jgi:hypothetical protein
MLPVEAIESPTTFFSSGAEKETNICFCGGLESDTTKLINEPVPEGYLTNVVDDEIHREISELVKKLIEKEFSCNPKLAEVNPII